MKVLYKEEPVSRRGQFINVFVTITHALNMRFLVAALVFVGVAYGDEDGQYRPESVGFYESGNEDGRYVHDNSGQYVPDDSGLYVPDDSGRYLDDGTGRYTGTNDRYRHEGGLRFRPNSGQNTAYRLQSILSAQTSRNEQFARPNTFEAKKYQLKTNNEVKRAFGSKSSSAPINPTRRYPSGGFPAPAKYNQGRFDDGRWRIIKQSGNVGNDAYQWEYETENGIIAEENGKVVNKGNKDAEAMRAKGYYKYTGPDNIVYTVSYTADENGFIAKGNHLPTPPPIPSEIIKALELQRAAGKLQ
ncbi:PREDICTED: larval cuticle protein LCP-30-like [Nicrophorus vespilloides]|uniref:Larval cuticle protein LCP-30-like n=1 Tax=Nicrophorus vespilloides TaxID=110193 RepID=A0ABM1NFZ7_NICVS|nr:PREDICTED: larval cuticle protein LCP-30-like [Nicrophorus vespilloides]